MGCAIGLIALGVGYMVFLSASKEQGSLRQVGRIIGAVIIVASIITGICTMLCKKGGCPMSGKAPMCHFSKKA